jgi:hypothetical protein
MDNAPTRRRGEAPIIECARKLLEHVEVVEHVYRPPTCPNTRHEREQQQAGDHER